MRTSSALGLVTALFTLTARAQDAVNAAGGGPPLEEGGSLAWVLLRTLLMLGFVVLLVFIVLNFGLRKLMGLSRFSNGPRALVRVVERVALEPKRTLYVVEAAGEYLLVGAAEGGLSLLGKLDAAAVERSKPPSPPLQGSSFLERFRAARGESKGPPPSAPAPH